MRAINVEAIESAQGCDSFSLDNGSKGAKVGRSIFRGLSLDQTFSKNTLLFGIGNLPGLEKIES